MTIVDIPSAKPAHVAVDRRNDPGSPTTPATTAPRTSRRRRATNVRNAVRDRQPIDTLSDLVLSDIHHVHSLHR